MLAETYAALRPVNLRSASGPTRFARGSDVRLAYEIVNASSGSVLIPLTSIDGRSAGWIGLIQTWIERLGRDPGLERCLPTAARVGNRYALSGQPGTLGVSGFPIEPGQGRTLQSGIPGQWTTCFPTGRYRVSLEYRRVEAEGPAATIAGLSIDIELRDPTAWSAQLAFGGMGRATLTVTDGGSRATSTVELSQLEPGVKYTVEIRAGCDRDGALLVGPATFVAAESRSHRDTRDIALSEAARRALGAGKRPSIWLFSRGYGACTAYAGTASPLPAGRGPTTWGGTLLRETLGGGFAVTASAEAIRPGDGRPSQAFDGDVNQTWNSGWGVPAWIEIDLGRNRSVAGLRLLPSQLPTPAPTVHRVYGRADGHATEVLITTLDGVTHDNVWLTVAFPRTYSVRYVRIETVTSPSTIAWREIELDGVAIPHASRMPVGTHDGTTFAVAVGPACQAVGWASDPDAPTDLTVRVLIDGKQVVTAPAGMPREGVAAAGAGDLTSGFQVDLRPYMGVGSRHEVRVQAQDLETDRWVDLAATPRTLTCA